MGIFTKAIHGHDHHDHNPDRELGHSMSYDLIQGVFYRGAGLGDDYENVYEFVRPLAERFSRIQPYAIDANGKPVENVPAVNALYRPNQTMSYTQFFDALMTGIKTQPEVYILVWHRKGRDLIPGGKITKDNIAGYTFLQGVSKINTLGVITYQVSNSKGEVKTYTKDELIILSDSRNPGDVSQGYSPLRAVKKWITVDDYIVSYQQGFFRNGAVPTGSFDIAANSVQDFKDIKARMQEAHRGASQNNNITYSYTPIDANGKKQDSQIKWTPFSVQNKDMELGVLTENIQKRKESVYGVPGVIRGVDDSANYATAQVMERSFVVNKLDPATHNIWSSWTHELNRITGGLGVAITYDLDIPAVADEEKVQAETKTLEFKLITDALAAGWSLDSAIDALDLSNRYKLLKTGSGAPKIENDKPQVDDGTSDDDSPDENGAAKGIKSFLASKAVGEAPRRQQEAKLSDIIRDSMNRQVALAVSETKAFGDAPEEEIERFVNEMMIVIASGMALSGEIEHALGIELLRQAGISTTNVGNYALSPETIDDYRVYLQSVGRKYTEETAQVIRAVLDKGNVDGLTLAELKRELESIMGTANTEYRIHRLAVTETNRSMNLSSIDSMKKIAEETGISVEKGFQHEGGDTPCEFCQTILSTWIPIDELLLPLGSILVGADGGIMINEFADNDGWDVHPLGHCVPVYRIVR